MKKIVSVYFWGLLVLFTAGSAMAQMSPPSIQATAAEVPSVPQPPAKIAEQTSDSAPLTPPSPPIEQREMWSGSLYTSTYRAGACITHEGKVRGVLLLRTMSGKTDTYHFNGTLEDGIIRASHTSGHRFKGTFPSTTEVKGTITLKSGRSISLTGKRELDVPLTESCRPLPQ